jgi:2-aminophenol/2-amino-5-chlorophenol 1,6-dioxygenase alpha subunit
MNVIGGFIVSGLPHPLLCPEASPGYGRLRRAYEAAREEIARLKPDVLLVYSTMWPSVIGHQLQADPTPTWTHVDELFHDLGSIPYAFRIDTDFAQAWSSAGKNRGLQLRTVSYHGFPIDTGSIVALKLLNPDNAFPAVICSSNVYADRSETMVLAKSAIDALAAQGKRAVAVCVMSLSNRLFTEFIDPADDRIHSKKDEEWNAKLLEFFSEGRLEDVTQLSRQIQQQIRIQKVVSFKSLWWLSALMGAHNHYTGTVYGYAPVVGTGASVIGLIPAEQSVGDREFDEDSVERFDGDRHVLGGLEDPSR